MVASGIAVQLVNLRLWRNTSLLLKTQPRRMVGAGNILLSAPSENVTKQHTHKQTKINIKFGEISREKLRETHIFCCHTRNIISYKQRVKKWIAKHKNIARAGGKALRKYCFSYIPAHHLLPTASHIWTPNAPEWKTISRTLYLYYRFAFLILNEEWIFLKKERIKHK